MSDVKSVFDIILLKRFANPFFLFCSPFLNGRSNIEPIQFNYNYAPHVNQFFTHRPLRVAHTQTHTQPNLTKCYQSFQVNVEKRQEKIRRTSAPAIHKFRQLFILCMRIREVNADKCFYAVCISPGYHHPIHPESCDYTHTQCAVCSARHCWCWAVDINVSALYLFVWRVRASHIVAGCMMRAIHGVNNVEKYVFHRDFFVRYFLVGFVSKMWRICSQIKYR